MDDVPADETIELSIDRWIVLAFAREWPRYVVNWSVRQRAGDSDFPLLSGQASLAPERDRSSEEMWSQARDLATDDANAALETRVADAPTRKRGLLSRIFSRG
jgi:hypothetical protein